MADSVFEMMKATAAASIPHYRQELENMNHLALRGVLDVLEGQPLSPATRQFLGSLGAPSLASYQRLAELEPR